MIGCCINNTLPKILLYIIQAHTVPPMLATRMHLYIPTSLHDTCGFHIKIFMNVLIAQVFSK